MRIIKDDRNQMGTNSYLLIEDDKSCYIIDAASRLESFQELIESENLNLKYIILTHGHFDHTIGLEFLRNKYKVPVVAHKEERSVLIDRHVNLSSMIGSNIEFEADIYLDGEQGNFEIFKYYLVPGHTTGGCCFLYDKHLFTGDALFQGSIGRTDFPGGNYQVLISNIKEKLLVLNPETVIYPGHGPESTIGIEEQTNPFLK